MDQACLAFCLTQPVVKISPYDSVEVLGLPLNKLNVLCDKVVENYCAYQLQSSGFDASSGGPMSPHKQRHYVVFLSGPSLQVISAQRSILNKYPSEASVLYRFISKDTLLLDGAVKPVFQQKIEDIMRQQNVIIDFPDTDTRSGSINAQLNTVYITIQGRPAEVEKARLELIRLTAMAEKMHVGELEISPQLLNIVCGAKHATIRTIEKATNTNIYLPRHYGSLLDTHSFDSCKSEVLVVGEVSATAKAVEMLMSTMQQIETDVVSCQYPLQPRKLDWLPILKYQDLLSVMEDNGTTILFPPANSKKSFVTIYGKNEREILRTIVGITHMTSDMFSGWLWLESNIPSSQPIQLPAQHQLNELIFNICKSSGAEIKYQNHCFEIFGQPQPSKDAFRAIEKEFSFKLFQKECKAQIELSTEHREFISGKKNGKVNKIMKMSNVKIGFENFNDHTFFINVYSPQCSKTLNGIELLQEELPAELSFFVPEAYHKRIIGVGGRNIQRIMKQFGVYVKFSTAEEFAALGAVVDSGDNVVARTPAKNVISLFNFKQAILDLVENSNKEMDWCSDSGFSANAVPPRTAPSSRVSHSRHDSGYHHGGFEQLPMETTSEEYFMRLPSSPALAHSIESSVFQELTRQIKCDFNIALTATTETTPMPGMHPLNDSGHYTFSFKYDRRDVHKLPRAQQILKDYLESSQITFFNSVGFATNRSFDMYPRRASSSMPQMISDPRPQRDNRSYSLFDLDASAIFEPNTQRRNTYTSLNAHKYQHPAINQSTYQHRRYSSIPLEQKHSTPTSNISKDDIWLPHENALSNGSLGWINNTYGRAHVKNKPNLEIWARTDEASLPFETPGPVATNNSTERDGRKGPSSLYSGYYGF
ncbi:hypothetical protein K493DRAFT_370681 [Basidiobolus meristosporus CBS 931.73]|uniref:K Homology domain-containing protein n=1 Tax=Basidiobolus meristosporus CBS 931.73 TaxID=1314790 RepID=A0A1Y1YFD5_9FUNG|nr:hypothetical protein K493DRAFT_370681 [Basidiobolus meristosporus CBS 931.73]|eukprot:ORX96668.1 hypothetical protein K493DRAFT_370681 [Basidiobolus meristosporus CBS 931.73]